MCLMQSHIMQLKHRISTRCFGYLISHDRTVRNGLHLNQAAFVADKDFVATGTLTLPLSSTC